MSKVCPACNKTYADAQAFCPTDGTALRATDIASSFVGSIIADRYVVTELLGEGGMGKVYLARHVKLPRQAAIKVLHARMVKDADAIARFNREAANASRIDHDRVARVFDFGETTDGLVYLAMEYIEGRTLKRLLEEDGPMPPVRASRVVRQIAEGLDAAHRLGIVHRDLKPDNILVTRDERGVDRCKVVDFGIAKAIGSGERSLTQTGFVVGTPEYMSPEQLLGQDIDHRSDVYALALLAYQCLTGEPAFDNKTPDRGLMARLTSEPRSLGTVRPDKRWPEQLQVVFNKGLSRDRDQRHGSALGFADDFDLAAAAKAAPLEKPAKKPVAKIESKAEASTDAKSAPPVQTPAGGNVAPTGRSAGTPPQGFPPNAQYPMPYATPPQPGYPPGYPGGAPMYAPGYPPAAAPTAPRARGWRFPRFPRFPIVRWAGTLFIIWFAYLLITEGSFRRAVRRVTSVVRGVEADARRMVPGGTPAGGRRASDGAAAATVDGPGGAQSADSVTAGTAEGSGTNLPVLGKPPTVVVPPAVRPPPPDSLSEED